MTKLFALRRKGKGPSLAISLTPILLLISSLIATLCIKGTDAITAYGSYMLIGSAAVALVLSYLSGTLHPSELTRGMKKSASQILPAIPLLVLIALISTTWMLSGIVPTLVYYGIQIINPVIFPFMACVVCAVVAILTGSSWSSIATIGVAFMGIGGAMGYHDALTAGAIISGAYFGDKISPLSDTTVVASSACGVDIFKHVKYMMVTSVPAMIITLAAAILCGIFLTPTHDFEHTQAILASIDSIFFISPWLLLVPLATGIMIAVRINTLVTLAVSSLLGLAVIFLCQPDILALLGSPLATVGTLWDGALLDVEPAVLRELTETSGILGMSSTIFLIISAMIFGGVMMGTGMLSAVTHTLTARLSNRTSTVTATSLSGLCLISCTADQYLSLIVAGNMYRDQYSRLGLDPRLLSRTIEDSVTVTSPLIPWGSCGVTQSSVLGVATLAYAPFAIFCWLSPLITILIARLGYKIKPLPAPTMRQSLAGR